MSSFICFLFSISALRSAGDGILTFLLAIVESFVLTILAADDSFNLAIRLSSYLYFDLKIPSASEALGPPNNPFDGFLTVSRAIRSS